MKKIIVLITVTLLTFPYSTIDDTSDTASVSKTRLEPTWLLNTAEINSKTVSSSHKNALNSLART